MTEASIEEIRQGFVRLWGRLGPFWGVPPATARVYAFLLSLADGAEAERVAEGLEMSRGAVSMATRELADWGLVLAERSPGSRRVTYRVETDTEHVVRSIVRTRKRREWDPILDNVSTWREALGRNRSQEAAVLCSRLEQIEAIVGLVDDLAESFLRGNAVSRLGLRAIAAAARRKRGGGR